MLQNAIARSHAALPLTTIYALALWALIISQQWPSGSFSPLSGIDWISSIPLGGIGVSLLCFLVSSYLMVELNNRNTLMHTYSRMVSCSFIMLTMMCMPIIIQPKVMAVQLCVIIALTLFFMTYQRRESVGMTFFAYLMIGIASLLWAPILFFLPLLWIAQANFMISFSWRALMASLFGILTPYWITIPIVLFTNTYNVTLNIFLENFTPNNKLSTLFTDPSQILQSPSLPFSSLSFDKVGDWLLLFSALLITIMLITGMIHYFRNFQKDKIKVSMIYQFICLLAIPSLLAMIIIIPLPFDSSIHFHMLLAILIVLTSPFIAHYITLTSTKVTNISVIAMILLVLIITALNYIPTNILPFAL